ncbi:sulfotransferase [Shewanella sp. MEBiC00475]|uniref:sulfotransferase n=1 Tax=Shewanella sp. MEBiC00475 TaxID=2575361 RepID=UPI0010BFDA7B|nr:sulfotransferase [Shewanella sp. MEBiC00475]
MINNKVFVLGDSRTGTSSLNAYLMALGINSKHYYVKESEQTSPDHENRTSNLTKLLNYIDSSEYNGFTDYPTRLYYKELYESYPDSFFILTVRENTERWLNSMLGYFPKFGMELNKKQIIHNYEKINNDISVFFGNNSAKFLVVNIDDCDDLNSNKIKLFLGIKSSAVIGKENTTEDIDVEDVSKRKILYRYSGDDWVSYLESVCQPYKTLLSEKGWIYLINDSNDFYRWAYGINEWDESHISKVNEVFSSRLKCLADKGGVYLKYITPEKNVIYNEFLPHIFNDKRLSNTRPAKLLGAVEGVHYLDKYLTSLKGWGNLYFRGDSHVNWLGAYYIYRHVLSECSKKGLNVGAAIVIDDLKPIIADYRGDLYEQVSNNQKTDIRGVWGDFNKKDSLSYEIAYKAPQRFDVLQAPEDYINKYGESREVIVTEILDSKLPTAVVFRDSTCDFIQPLISNHFKRVVYIWHKGNVYSDVIEKEKPDVVLHFMAERFVSNYFARESFS